MNPDPSEPSPATGRVIGLLTEGESLFEELAQVCRRQAEALARHDTDEILALTERAETIAARFHLLESTRRDLEGDHPPAHPELDEARRRLATAAAGAAVAAEGSAALLLRGSAATSAIRRVIDGAESAGYLPNGEPPRQAGGRLLEERA